jgi:hypothetical protein
MANIPFIHNYCDRWCERCCFTASCAVFEANKDITAEEQDVQNKAFWDRFKRNFEKAQELLVQGALKHGIDLNKIPQEELDAIAAEEEEITRQTEEHALIKMCREYAAFTSNFMENEPLWKQKGDEMIQQEKLGTIGIQELEDQLRLMKECRDIIQWYQFFIHVKFTRAVSGLIEGDRFQINEAKEHQTDFNGSAKIALIALERSQLAWTQLFTVIPEEDLILPILSLLSRIEKLANENFPDAKKFIRPGFDEIERIEIPPERATAKPGVFFEFKHGSRR